MPRARTYPDFLDECTNRLRECQENFVGPLMPSYQLDRFGVFWRTQEADFVELPATITSDFADSEWRVEARDESDLLRAIQMRWAEPDARFSVEDVFRWACEAKGQCEYCGNFPKPLHNTQGILDEGFTVL